MPAKPFRPRNVISPRRTGLESNTQTVLYTKDGRNPRLRWVNFWGTTLPWINNANIILPWI